MAGETNDADAEADRLEAALERLAVLTRAAPPSAASPQPPAASAAMPADEISTRLYSLIDKLRATLGGRPA